MIAAAVLAAGESARMGYPKALLAYRGGTFLDAVLATCAAAGFEPRIVVLGHHEQEIRRGVALDDVIVVRSENLAAGPIGSIRTAVRLLADHPADAVLVWPVDRPHVTRSTVERLAEAFLAGTGPIVTPAYRGRRGHPLVFDRSVFEELLAAPDDVGARYVVRADPTRVVTIAVEDPAVRDNLDTPEAYRALLRREDERERT